MENRKHNHIDAWDDGSYGTGNTCPPKSHSGIIALLLILVIFLSGIVSVLSYLNIQLFYELSEQRSQDQQVQAPVSFSNGEDLRGTAPSVFSGSTASIGAHSLEPGKPTLGITGEAITRFDQHYFHVPEGLYINSVAEGTSAEAQDVNPGDILLSLDGQPITSQEQLEQFLSRFEVGDTLTAVLYRNGQEQTITLTVGEIEN